MGSHHGADVFYDRTVGRTKSHRGWIEVRAIQSLRKSAVVDWDIGAVSSGWHLRHSITGGFHLFRKFRVLDIFGIVFGLCDQATHVAISHLASRRALRGSNRR